jgi:hypothetical protein
VLQQSESTGSDHSSSGDRISPEALYAVTEVNRSILAAKAMHPYVFLFDDVLTMASISSAASAGFAKYYRPIHK